MYPFETLVLTVCKLLSLLLSEQSEAKMAREEQYVLQVSYGNQQSKLRRLYTTRSGICTWSKFIATIKSQIEYLLVIDIGMQYKDPGTGVWIVLSQDDRDITDLLDRTKQQNKMIHLSVMALKADHHRYV